MAKTVFDELSALCLKCASEVNKERVRLGVRPDDPDQARHWSQQVNRLRNQADSLIGMASDLNAIAISTGLENLNGQFEQIKQATKDAKTEIAKIKEISRKLTTFARILDLGLAVIAIPAAFSVGGVQGAAQAAEKAVEAAAKIFENE